MNSCPEVSVILLAGGEGSRFGSAVPKQFLLLGGQPVAHYSYRLFAGCREVSEIIVVCPPDSQELFHKVPTAVPLHFALPGTRRQDSVYNGLQVVRGKWTCIHDSARPFVTKLHLQRLLTAAKQHGAAAGGLPVKVTVKQINDDQFVRQTLNRSNLWEIQTPQIIRTDWLKKGFASLEEQQLAITDDVSIVEQLGMPVKMIPGEECNIKITTRHDFFLAEKILEKYPQ